MRNYLLVILFALIMVSCKEDPMICCTNIDTIVDIQYLNEGGENLFEISDGYLDKEIKVYFKDVDGSWNEHFRGTIDNHKDLSIVETEDGTYIRLFPSDILLDNNYTETKIEFSQDDVDVIKTQIDKGDNFEIVTKVWFDDELKWEMGDSERIIQVVK